MGRKLRVFVSSTMKDMPNERQAVIDRLALFNFEPVNAESLSPDGTDSWAHIQSEIESSDIFVLLLGPSYGWIPSKGPNAGQGLSVTHLEFNYAKNEGIPILAFLKRLDYGAKIYSKDAKKRDAFRKEVQDWDGGYFTTEFNIGVDLADSVGKSLISLLTDKFQKSIVKKRSNAATKVALTLANEYPIQEVQNKQKLPLDLVEAVRDKNAILFAGSGISLTAGLPSSYAFSQRLIQMVRELDPSYDVNPTGTAFAGIATDLEASRGRQYLVNAISDLIHPPQGIEPTAAHIKAITLFDQIITTNYDDLFETAVLSQHIETSIVTNELKNSLQHRTLVKLHGSANVPESLLLTERDVFMLDQNRPKLCKSLQEELRHKMVVVVGASLRDPSIVRLLSEVGDELRGYFIVPYLWKSTPERLRPWNLKCIQMDANTFMTELFRRVLNGNQQQ